MTSSGCGYLIARRSFSAAADTRRCAISIMTAMRLCGVARSDQRPRHTRAHNHRHCRSGHDKRSLASIHSGRRVPHADVPRHRMAGRANLLQSVARQVARSFSPLVLRHEGLFCWNQTAAMKFTICSVPSTEQTNKARHCFLSGGLFLVRIARGSNASGYAPDSSLGRPSLP